MNLIALKSIGLVKHVKKGIELHKVLKIYLFTKYKFLTLYNLKMKLTKLYYKIF